MAKDSKKEALEKFKKKGDCEKCGSKKHSTNEHKKYEGSEKDKKEDEKEIDEE